MYMQGYQVCELPTLNFGVSLTVAESDCFIRDYVLVNTLNFVVQYK